MKGILNEIGRQIDKKVNKNGGGGHQGQGFGAPGDYSMGGGGGGMQLVQGIFSMLNGGGGRGGGGGGSGGSQLTSIINMIQTKGGGMLPGSVNKFLPQILKVAEIISHGMGDTSQRTSKNADGTIIDNFIKTIVGGRKIHGRSGKIKRFKPKIFNQGRENDGSGGYGYWPGGSDPGVAGGVQDFDILKQKHLSTGTLFEDPEFPAVDDSVYYSDEGKRRNFEWLRPHEICSHPSFFVEGASRFDVIQGELGDCWLLAAIANVTLNQRLFHQVVPEDNSFERHSYCGLFHFRFWQYGSWVDVVVDDRLPTVRGKLIFMHSEEKREFWSALLEKAYAKLHGSYEALKGGTTCEALEDFTGGVTELYDIRSAPSNLLQMMLNAFERGSFLACSIEPDPNVLEAKTRMGLIRGHAYSITAVKLVDIQTPRVSGKIPLIRIKNPWGNEVEWKGAWSDGSQEWGFIDDYKKREIGLAFRADGEFWMSYKDFEQQFDQVEFCNLSADSLDDNEFGHKRWNTSVFEGAWIPGRTAGGCRNFLQTFSMNPQYTIDLEDPDENGDCSIVVALMQKNRRVQKKYGVDCLTIGFAIYKVPKDVQSSDQLAASFFKYNASTARSPTFINLREVTSRFKLRPGRYVIIPSTYEPNEEGEFLLRVISESYLKGAPSAPYMSPQSPTSYPPPTQTTTMPQQPLPLSGGHGYSAPVYPPPPPQGSYPSFSPYPASPYLPGPPQQYGNFPPPLPPAYGAYNQPSYGMPAAPSAPSAPAYPGTAPPYPAAPYPPYPTGGYPRY